MSSAPDRSGTGHARHGGDRPSTTCSYVSGISQTSSTSSLTTCDLVSQYPLFPNPVVAESLLDRLINTSHQVFMNGPSYRPNNRPGRVTLARKEDTT